MLFFYFYLLLRINLDLTSIGVVRTAVAYLFKLTHWVDLVNKDSIPDSVCFLIRILAFKKTASSRQNMEKINFEESKTKEFRFGSAFKNSKNILLKINFSIFR